MALWSSSRLTSSRGAYFFLIAIGSLALILLSVQLLSLSRKPVSSFSEILETETEAISLNRELDSNLPRVMVVFGTRPEAIKMAPVIQNLQNRHGHEVETVVVSVGQHREMLASVLRADAFKDIKIDVDLDLMTANQTLSSLAARALYSVSQAINIVRPQIVVVQGDTSSAMVASEAAFYEKVPEIAHVEAGLRTYDRYNPYPEDVNRRVIGVTGTTHFPPTWVAADHLLGEGSDKDGIFSVGNTVIDSVLNMVSMPPSDKAVKILQQLGLDGKNSEKAKLRTILVTAHRRESFGGQMRDMMVAMRTIVEKYSDVQLVYPVHMNPNVRKQVDAVLRGIDRVILMPPLDYQEFVPVLSRVTMVLTDSGGLQEECSALRKPVLVMRKTTERPEGVHAGVSQIVGTDKDAIVTAVSHLLDNKDGIFDRMSRPVFPYGDGLSGRRIAMILANKAVALSQSQSTSAELTAAATLDTGLAIKSGPCSSAQCKVSERTRAFMDIVHGVPMGDGCRWERECELGFMWERVLIHSLPRQNYSNSENNDHEVLILDAAGPPVHNPESSCDGTKTNEFGKFLAKQIPGSKIIVNNKENEPALCVSSNEDKDDCKAPEDGQYHIVLFGGATVNVDRFTDAEDMLTKIRDAAKHVLPGGIFMFSARLSEMNDAISVKPEDVLALLEDLQSESTEGEDENENEADKFAFEELLAGDVSGKAMLESLSSSSSGKSNAHVTFHALRRKISSCQCAPKVQPTTTEFDFSKCPKASSTSDSDSGSALAKRLLSGFTLDPKPDWPHPVERDIPQLLELPERPNAPEKSYTVVIGMYRRPEVVARLFDSMLEQTIKPAEVWVALWNSPNEGEIIDEIEKWRKTHEDHRDWVKLVNGQPDLKYWGRFQLALQVQTPFLIVLDDDCIPQPKWAELALHCLCTEEYRGLLGLKGHPADRPSQVGMDFWGPVAKTPVIKEADVVGGAWVLESQWLRIVYRENPWTWNTGEDFNMAHSMHKYANIRSFVLPHDEERLEYAGVTPDYLDISYSKDTTGAFGFLPLRYDLTEHLYRRGTKRIGSDGRWATHSVVGYVDHATHAEHIGSVLKYVHGMMPLNCGTGTPDSRKPIEVGLLFGSELLWAEDMGLKVGQDLWDYTWNRYANWNVSAAGTHPDINYRPIDRISNTMFTTNMVINADGPAFIVLVADSSPGSVGAALAAQHAQVPIVSMVVNDDAQKATGYAGASASLSAANVKRMSVFSSSDACEIADFILTQTTQ